MWRVYTDLCSITVQAAEEAIGLCLVYNNVCTIHG